MPVSPCRMRYARGFTLVELVLVIVILGVLAAVALPRFSDVSQAAEQRVVGAWVGALRAAYGTMHANGVIHSSGYPAPYAMSLYAITRCDEVDFMEPRNPPWQGHHIALGPLRESVFANRTQTACNNNTISFTTRSGRTVTITNSGNGVTWTAAPAY